MKKEKRKKCAGLIAVIFLVMSLGACGRKSSIMEAEFNDETRGYEVTAENAEETVCTGSITVSAGECLAVSSDLEKGCMVISAFSAEDFEGVSKDGFAEALSKMSEDDEEKAALRETISGNNVRVYPLAQGTYYIAFITEKESTSGTLKAMPFSIEELKEQNKELADTLGKEAFAVGDDASSDMAGTDASSDAAGEDASKDAAGKGASTDAAGKGASTDAADKGASTDAAGKDASTDATGKGASTDAAGKDASTDVSASSAAESTAAESANPGSDIAVSVEGPAKNTESAGEEDGQNPVMGFIGPYTYDRIGMYIEPEGMHNARVSIAWGSSAREHSEWTMSGPFDEKTLTITYSDCVRKDFVFNEEGDVESETTVYENGTGSITFREGEDLSLVWKDDQDHIADNGVFTWSFVPPEE